MRLREVVAGAGLSLMVLCAVTRMSAQQTVEDNAALLKRATDEFREGFELRQSGHLQQAYEKFADVVKLAPDLPQSHEALGAVLLELGRSDEAVAELQIAQRMNPGEPGNEANLGIAYARAGHPAEAIPFFEAAMKAARAGGQTQLPPSFYDQYAHALEAAGKLDAALAEFNAEEAAGAKTADVEDAIGSVYAQQGKWDEAKQHSQQALALNGMYVKAWVHLGVAQRELGDVATALTTLDAATKIPPPDATALYEYARTQTKLGMDVEAVRAFERALKVNPQMGSAQIELAMALQRLGRQPEAIPSFEKVVAREPHNDIALTNLGVALTLTGNAKEGLTYFNRAAADGQKDAALLKDMGLANLQLSLFDEAIADFEKALAIEPNDPQLHYDLGVAYKFKDRLNDAAAELEKAATTDPGLPDAPYALGILYMQMGRPDDAVTQLKHVVALRPENGDADAWALLANAQKQAGRLAEAAESSQKATTLLPGQSSGNAANRERATVAMNAGNQLMLRGQIGDAIARYQESVGADSTFADPHTQLAIAYERQGRPGDAAAERARATELAKTN